MEGAALAWSMSANVSSAAQRNDGNPEAGNALLERPTPHGLLGQSFTDGSPVGGHLQAVLEEGDAPGNEDGGNDGPRLELQRRHVQGSQLVGHGLKVCMRRSSSSGVAQANTIATHLEVEIPSRIHELQQRKWQQTVEMSDDEGRQAGGPAWSVPGGRARTELLPMSSRMAPTPCTALLAMVPQLLSQWPSGFGDMPRRVRAGRQAAAGTARRRDVQAGSRAAAAFLGSWRQRSDYTQQLWAHNATQGAGVRAEGSADWRKLRSRESKGAACPAIARIAGTGRNCLQLRHRESGMCLHHGVASTLSGAMQAQP